PRACCPGAIRSASAGTSRASSRRPARRCPASCPGSGWSGSPTGSTCRSAPRPSRGCSPPTRWPACRRGVSPVAAATLPLNGLTAAQALDRLGLRAGETLLVTGAAGAVGGFAVQLAAARGIRVVAVAGAEDEPLVRELGAELFVPR